MQWRWLILSCAVALAGCGDDTPSDGASSDVATTTDASSDLSVDEDVAPDTGFLDECGPDEVAFENIGLVGLDAEGMSERLFFDIPECANSFLVVLEGPDQVHFILDELTSPDGDVLITSEASEPINPFTASMLGPYPGQFQSPNRMISNGGISVAMVPNSTGITMSPGPWDMIIQGGTPTGGMGDASVTPYAGGVTVDVMWKNFDTLEDGGVLDVNLHFSGADDIDATAAPDSLIIQGALSRLGEIYAQVNITIGEVRYYDIDEAYRTINSIEGPGNELSQMFRESEGNEQGMNYFFVDRFELQGMPGGMIGGISGGLPGPPLRPGSSRSGVAVAITAAGRDPNVLAHVMAHEGGHFLGLFHVIEMIGGEDPLDDTPNGSDANTNLMYPAVGGGTTLTAEQTRVVHNHPEVAQ